jgi:hypothetical protein
VKAWGITTFPSHEDVACLRCRTPLGRMEVTPALAMLGVGAFTKRCPKCNLATSYDVSPAEAAAIEYEEPDWEARFARHMDRFGTVAQLLSTPTQVRLANEDKAFEATLKDWRRWHAIDDKPATAYEGMLALLALNIMPPRSLIGDIERTSACFREQFDDHMWLTMSQRAWRIITVESRTLFLESFGEQTQVDLSRAKWEKYCEKAAEALEAMKKKDPPPECQ